MSDEENKTYQILRADVSNAPAIPDIQKTAYLIEAERYNDYNITPLKQTLEELIDQFKDHIVLKAVLNGKIIGTVRACEKAGTCCIGRLAVLPEMHNRGIGAALMKEIEACFHPQRYELFVGAKSDNNIHLYQKLGYHICRKTGYECGAIEIFYMEKGG